MQMENISVNSWILTNLIRRNPSMVAWTSITTALRCVYLIKEKVTILFNTALSLWSSISGNTPGELIIFYL